MEGDELTDLSLTRAKLRKKDDHHRFKASLTCFRYPLPATSDLRVTSLGLYWSAEDDSQALGELGQLPAFTNVAALGRRPLESALAFSALVLAAAT